MANGGYREFKLDNGLIVALQETPTQTIYGGLRVNHGALHEHPGEEGFAHFLEHALITGGTERYTPDEISELRGRFGQNNAFTFLNMTTFPSDLLATDVEDYLAMLPEIVFRPRFEPGKVDEERQRVLREIGDEKSSKAFQVERQYSLALLGEGPHNYYVKGKEESIQTATPETLRAFHSRGYHPNNSSLILVGGIPKNIDAIVQQHFGKIPTGGGSRYVFPQAPPLEQLAAFHIPASELMNEEKPEESSAELRIGIRGPPLTHEDSYVVAMLAWILGGGGGSRLFKRVSQQEGLAYSIQCSYGGTEYGGVLEIRGRILARGSQNAVDGIFEEIQRLRTEQIDQEEFNKLKRVSMYWIAKAEETNEGHAVAIQKKLDYGITPEMHLARANAVTPRNIQEAAHKYLPADKNGKFVFLLRDPFKKLE
ncbi:insulinase family protein [Candidatus Woesearchaeota archaeon]|nr:insulinase family protein [Candidatus Woesearchaeota archaeon]